MNNAFMMSAQGNVERINTVGGVGIPHLYAALVL